MGKGGRDTNLEVEIRSVVQKKKKKRNLKFDLRLLGQSEKEKNSTCSFRLCLGEMMGVESQRVR